MSMGRCFHYARFLWMTSGIASFALGVMRGVLSRDFALWVVGGRLFDDTDFLWWIWIFGRCLFMQSMAGGVASVKLLFPG